METLKDQLEKFSFDGENIDKLTEEFARLAPYFISGGHIRVRDEYCIYPTTVEFYFHSEQPNGVKDDIVYHREKRMLKENIKLPYFPIMSLHAHDSGFDITFENKEMQYRASALIREYQVWDIQGENWLKWDTKNQYFRGFDKSIDSNPINTQVLYLKKFLNGFGMGNNEMKWEDSSTLLNKDEIVRKTRKGVKDNENQGKKKEWSFSRKTFIE